MTLDSRLKEIKEHCEAATEGPLEVIRFDNEGGYISYQIEQKDIGGPEQIFAWCSEQSNMKSAKKNADFIAHARTDVEMLLEMLDLFIGENSYPCETVIEELEKIAETYT